ncbi:hypothetical protein [Burkholderia ubonensis]|uniref:hypothetical protein n=1 Tax=Burkholderia ubonensis TaxID=101571 RepID=UPI00116078D0|nr:hypothetical protein [Burkholderia ubonensis]
MRGEIERDLERLARVLKQIRALEVQQEQQVPSGVQPTVARLARLVGIGIGSAWTLSKELFERFLYRCPKKSKISQMAIAADNKQ